MKLKRIEHLYPSNGTECLEDWLVDVANSRGARIVFRPAASGTGFAPPPVELLSNEELVVAICQFECLDRPQMLRLAAQLISREAVETHPLILVARRERAGRLLAELARQALRIDPFHEVWRAILRAFRDERPLREPVLHWTRLAEPIPVDGRCNAKNWKLVA
jgi:hypothetical protein